MVGSDSFTDWWLVTGASVVLALALYVWVAVALAAMFRKIGHEPWKAWVPIVNQITLLMIAGLSGWLFLLILVPAFGWIALYIAMVVAAHRIGRGFGVGAGMTVLAALLFPVWATVLGFGPAVWRGASAAPSVASAYARTSGGLPPQAAAYPPPPPPPPLPPRAAARPAAPVAPPAAPPATQPIPVAWAPPSTPTGDEAPSAAGADQASPTPATRRAPAVTPTFDEWWASEIDEVSAIAQPVQGSPVAARPVATGLPAFADEDDDEPAAGRGRAGAGSVPDAQHTTGGGYRPDAARIADEDDGDEEPLPAFLAEPDAAPPAVTRAPAGPSRTTPPPGPEFPLDTADEVSAVAGAPVAGTPRSARTAVAAAQAAAAEDEFPDQTVVARRRRVQWMLQPGDGAAIDLTSEVVIVGRQPSADPAHPKAQLVAVQDGTRTVSKTHARLELRDDRWTITDLGSTNGVFLATLMGTEIEAEDGAELAPGERFLLGDANFRLERTDH